MADYAVRVKNITKEYKLYESELDRLKESFHPFKKQYHRVFYALKNVNFDIHEGEKVGIIGANGAGKSTLLKIITEVLNPSAGEIEINGKVAALLELGAGFNQNYTGLENIRLNGMLMGLSPEEMEDRKQKIIDFADIGEFIDQPVKNYSSGMFVRLAFATQIFSDPDILIVDEALSVGDIRFQQKCYRAMDSLMKNKTVVLVTHDTAAVTRFCERVIWLNHGEVVYDGEVAEGLKKYQDFLINRMNEEHGEHQEYWDEEDSISHSEQKVDLQLPQINPSLVPKGTGKAEITHCALLDHEGSVTEFLEPKKGVSIVSRVRFHETIQRPLYGITVYDRLGNVMFSLNSEMLGIRLPKGEGEVEYKLSFKLPRFNQGEYTISVAVAQGYQEDHEQLCWYDDALVFQVRKREHDLPGFFYLADGDITVTKL